ncbi:hypothetical protein RB653_009047 [Dictyostelium firmibasis]|uniref:Uncharacterized protein n=1 Tax=Dictyostelium firmibasis TaxID=79012 RepID=A0AAN7Z0A5_9MYCE
MYSQVPSYNTILGCSISGFFKILLRHLLFTKNYYFQITIKCPLFYRVYF